MKHLINKLLLEFPDIKFEESDTFYWSPEKKTVFYVKQTDDSPRGTWTLLHETAHAALEHKTYSSDLQLLQMESEAWEHAKKLAKGHKISIPNDYIEDCLDSYRDWLHLRSTCPICDQRSLQKDPSHYKCMNCKHIWKVSSSRMCRPYRMSLTK